MAKQQAPVKEKQPATAAQKPTVALTPFIFDQYNYLIMITGVVVILIGFALMSGGATTDPNVFPKEELYSFRRITLAPIVVMLGFGIEIFAILKRPKE
jgi:hypothetical protein